MPEALALSQWNAWWKHNGGRELRDLLLIWWDPIGVYGVPDAASEYDAYVGTVGRLLREGAREAQITAFLREVEEERITLSGDAPDAARKIIEWYDRVMAQVRREGPDQEA